MCSASLRKQMARRTEHAVAEASEKDKRHAHQSVKPTRTCSMYARWNWPKWDCWTRVGGQLIVSDRWNDGTTTVVVHVPRTTLLDTTPFRSVGSISDSTGSDTKNRRYGDLPFVLSAPSPIYCIPYCLTELSWKKSAHVLYTAMRGGAGIFLVATLSRNGSVGARELHTCNDVMLYFFRRWLDSSCSFSLHSLISLVWRAQSKTVWKNKRKALADMKVGHTLTNLNWYYVILRRSNFDKLPTSRICPSFQNYCIITWLTSFCFLSKKIIPLNFFHLSTIGLNDIWLFSDMTEQNTFCTLE